MKQTAWLAILGFACQASITVPACAGTVYESSVRDLRTNAAGKVRMQVDGGRLRIDQSTGTAKETALIFRDDTVYVLNPTDKSYVTIDREAIKKLADRVAPTLRQMQEQLANLPEAQRAMMESMMGGQAGLAKRSPPTIRATERTEKAAGYPCKVVSVLDGEALLREVCVAAPATLKGGQEVYDVAVKMGALSDEILATLDAPAVTAAMAQQMDNYSKLGGIPVVTRSYEDGKLAREARLQTVRSETVAPTQFEVPADYRPRDLLPQ